MKFFKTYSIFLPAVAFLSACTIHPDMADRTQSCNEHNAFAKGMNAGREGQPMSTDYISYCPSEIRNTMQKAYLKGYLQGNELLSEKTSTKNTAENGGVTINIGGRPVRPVNHGHRKYYCTIDTGFIDGKFSAFGPTRLETREAVKGMCEQKNGKNSLFCQTDEVQCQLNE
ncbi:hypothetical protein ACR2R9_004322 [Cronobacter sakazakii]